MKIPNLEYNRQILIEEAVLNGQSDVRAYTELNANADPGFFRWLFNSDGGDFEIPADSVEDYESFLDTLPTE